MPRSGNRSFTNQRRCWLAGHTSAEKLNKSSSIGGRERGRETFTSETEEVIHWWILGKGLKNRGLKSTRDNQVMEKGEKHFPLKQRVREVKIKRHYEIIRKEWQYKHLRARGVKLPGVIWWHVQEEQGSSLRVWEMSEDWKLKRVENRKQLLWGMQ